MDAKNTCSIIKEKRILKQTIMMFKINVEINNIYLKLQAAVNLSKKFYLSKNISILNIRYTLYFNLGL